MIVDELKEYKNRQLKIITLEQERIIYCNDPKKIKKIEEQLKNYKFKQKKIDTACEVLNKMEDEIISKLYKDMSYRFKTLLRAAVDLNVSYSNLRWYRNSALKKLEDWEKGIYL